MNNIAKRLTASYRLRAFNGDAHERAVCGSQMLEAARYIEHLEQQLQDALAALQDMAVIIDESLPTTAADELWQLWHQSSQAHILEKHSTILETARVTQKTKP
jgi:hypothetical protein